MADFMIWRSRYVEGYCVGVHPAGIPKSFQLSRGISRAAGWPTGLVCKMSDEFPKDIQLPDSLFGAGQVVVSPRVHALLAAAQTDRLELLPVGIADHKGRVVADDFAIVNPLQVVDAIDIEASEVLWNEIKADLIDTCARLVIDPARVPPTASVFRLKHLEHDVVVRGDLAARLQAANLIGLALVDPAAYTG